MSHHQLSGIADAKLTPSGSAIGDRPVLAARGLEFGYAAAAPVIRAVDAELLPGRVCALIGPNAAGKSTLLRLMLGQLRPWRGAVDLDGAGRVDAVPVLRRATQLSYVPQRGRLGFAFSVREVVRMGRYACGGDAGPVDEALRSCDLHDLQHREFGALSGGQQQRVLLARAIAQGSGGGRAMLLDEPVTGMDLGHVHETMRTLRRQAAEGMAVLTVLHDLNLAARYADDVWLLDDGAVVARGPWDLVMQRPRLESVYGVELTVVEPGPGGRPVFLVN